MSVDVEIYMSNIIKFFKQNQNELLSLVPKSLEEQFYLRIREVATFNQEKGDEVSLTQKQLIEICAQLNGKPILENTKGVFQVTKFGNICLN